MPAMIEFLCPNGHRIRCSEDRAGKPAKCPKCSVKFLIPTLEEIRAAQGEDAGSNATFSRDRTRIQFLCPNGHRLFGSADLQGRPGQCPECGVRFRIPVIEELTDDDADEAVPLSVAPEPSAGPQLATGTGLGDSAIVPESGIHLELFSPRSAGDSRTPESSISSPTSIKGSHLARIFQRLWNGRAAGSVVKVQLVDGQAFTVTKYSASSNDHEYAAFVVEGSAFGGGLVVVPWQSVRMIYVSGVKDIPSQLLD